MAVRLNSRDRLAYGRPVLVQRAILVGASVFIAEWVAAWVRGGLPSVGALRFVEAIVLSAACCLVGAAAVGLGIHVARSALRKVGSNTERFFVESGISLAAGLGILLEAIVLFQRLGIPVYGRHGLGQPWQPGVVAALVLGAVAAGLAALASLRGRGRLVAFVTATVWLHLAVGPAYVDMAARVTPRRHLVLVVLCLAVLDVAIQSARAVPARARWDLGASIAIALAFALWVAAPSVASNDAKLLVGGRLSVPYRVLATSVAAPWAPSRWKAAASYDDGMRALIGGRGTQPARGVVLVMIDTLRPDALDWRDDGRLLAPNLHEARARSHTWARAYATYPGTGPSAEAMLGRRESPSLVSRLHATGVQTVAVTASGPLLAPDFDEVDPSAKPPEMTHRMHRYADRVTAVALGHLSRLMEQPEPFLLLVHYMAPHAPYVASGSRLASAEVRYGEEIAYVDAELVPLLDALGDLTRTGKVTLIVASDHGEEFLEHGYGTHGVRLYDESMRIVLFARGPGLDATLSSAPVSGADLAPTLAALLGAATPDGPELLQAGSQDRVVHLRGANSFGCVRGPIKWIYDRETGYWERYDLIADPNERVNGADAHEVPGWCATRDD